MAVDREGPIQEAIVSYLRLIFPEPQIVHHARNEVNKRGKHIAMELSKAKRRGAVKGFPDIVVLPFSTLGAMFFEVKAEGRYANPSQRDIHDRLRALGYRIAVVRSIDDVREVLTEWGIPSHDVSQKSAPDD